jgi:hypothetical protein
VVAPHLFGILPHTPNSYRILASADYLFPASTGSQQTARLIAYFCKILGFCSGLLAHTYLLTLSTYQSGWIWGYKCLDHIFKKLYTAARWVWLCLTLLDAMLISLL